ILYHERLFITKKAVELMKKLEGVKINRTRDGQKILDLSDLPFIKTDEGDNYFGIEGVKDFVERELSRNKDSGTFSG
ncbi:MAG: hypothetical protein AAB616_01105, partial [Patescibacteria group bacterium]